MPPIQHNFKTLDEYNTYLKAHGLDAKPAQTTTTDENGNQVTQDTSFPKSVWEVYANRDSDKNENIGLSETGIDKNSVKAGKDVEELKTSLSSQLAEKGFTNPNKDIVSKYSEAALNWVNQNIEKLFAGFEGIKAEAKRFTNASDANDYDKKLNDEIAVKIYKKKEAWGQNVESDIKTQLEKARDLAEEQLRLNKPEDEMRFAEKDTDHSQMIELGESGITSSKIAEGANIKTKLNEIDNKDIIKEFIKSDKNQSGVDISAIKTAAEGSFNTVADNTIKASYENIEAKIGTANLDGNVTIAIDDQIGKIRSATIDNIIKQAEAEAKKQIRDEINKARNDAHQKAEQEEAARAQQQGNRPQTAADKIVGGFVDGASRAAGNLAENLFGGGQSSGSVPAGGGTESAPAATQTPQEEKQGGIRNPKPKLDNDDMITMSRARNKWGSGTITGKAYISAKDIKEGKMGNVSDVLQKVLSKKGFKDTENNNNIVSRLSSNSTVQEAVIKGNPEVFDKNGKVYGDADWNSLKLPSVKKMKEMIRAEEQA